MKYSVRKTREEDAEAGSAIILTELHKEFEPLENEYVEMKNKIKNSSGLVLLKYDEIIGIAIYSFNETDVYRGEPVNFIEHFIVKPEYRHHRRVLMFWGVLLKIFDNGKKTFLISKDVSTFHSFVRHIYSSKIEGYTSRRRLYMVNEIHREKILNLMDKQNG